jgi:hypothetical protein
MNKKQIQAIKEAIDLCATLAFNSGLFIDEDKPFTEDHSIFTSIKQTIEDLKEAKLPTEIYDHIIDSVERYKHILGY